MRPTSIIIALFAVLMNQGNVASALPITQEHDGHYFLKGTSSMVQKGIVGGTSSGESKSLHTSSAPDDSVFAAHPLEARYSAIDGLRDAVICGLVVDKVWQNLSPVSTTIQSSVQMLRG